MIAIPNMDKPKDELEQTERRNDMNDLEVLICGIPHTIRLCEDTFNADAFHMGQINYGEACIYINKELSPAIKTEQLCHEIIHGILVHLGYQEEAQDEKFVQQLGNAINQSFSIKLTEGE